MMEHLATPAGRPLRARRGFTIFEVAISLGLVSFGVVSVMLLFPIGLKQQQLSRFKILASVKAMEMLDSFTGTDEFTRSMDPETPEPWEGNNYAYSNERFQLETRLCNWHNGLLPIPDAIARRLDSDGDEIQQILADGGHMYYAQPMSNTNLDERWMAHTLPNDALKMICGITGYAQNKALPSLPYKEWPYRAAYPSPPVAGYLDDLTMQSTLNAPVSALGRNMYCPEWWFNGHPSNAGQVNPPAVDPLFFKVFSCAEKINDNNPQVRKDYIAAALAYGTAAFQASMRYDLPGLAVGHSDEFSTYYTPDQADDNTHLDALGAQYDQAFADFCRTAEMDPGDAQLADKMKRRADVVLRVQCMRFLAHSMLTLSMQHQIRDYDASDALVGSKDINNKKVTPGLLRYYHERCLAMVMRYAASFPYDEGAPRPQQRSIMMDHPLFEFDLFSAARSGHVAYTATAAAQWRPMAAQPVSNLGPASSYSGSFDSTGTYNVDVPPFPEWDVAMPNAFWGDPAHFTLTKPFKAAERCRQIVFWAADWQSYEDAETMPGSPLDSSKAPFMSIRMGAKKYEERTMNLWWQSKEAYHLLSPEYHLNFTKDVSTLATGTDVSDLTMFNNQQGEQLWQTDYKTYQYLNGAYGADRNYNGKLDRGPLSRSVRLHAMRISRFNYYDPRLPTAIR